MWITVVMILCSVISTTVSWLSGLFEDHVYFVDLVHNVHIVANALLFLFSDSIIERCWCFLQSEFYVHFFTNFCDVFDIVLLMMVAVVCIFIVMCMFSLKVSHRNLNVMLIITICTH